MVIRPVAVTNRNVFYCFGTAVNLSSDHELDGSAGCCSVTLLLQLGDIDVTHQGRQVLWRLGNVSP